MRMRVRLLLGMVVASLAVTMPPAEAVSGGTIALQGTHQFQIPITAANGPFLATTEFVFQGECTQALLHDNGKPLFVVGECGVQYEGLYTGDCNAGSGTGIGLFVDALGQPYLIEVTFVVTGALWTFTWAVDKPSTGETGSATGTGGWVPDPVACVTSGSPTAQAGAHVTLALL